MTLPNGETVSINPYARRVNEPLDGYRRLAKAIVWQALKDKRDLTEELESLPSRRRKRARNLTAEIELLDEFFASSAFDVCCESSEVADAIRAGINDDQLDRVLLVLKEDIEYV